MPSRDQQPNLLLVGFMGTGKSTLGRLLARRWRRPLVDTDEMVERLAGKTIPQIFEQDGEAAFRAKEREVVESHLPASGAVISCGGGLVIPEGMAALVASKGVVVTLFASPEAVLRRTQGKNGRPLLAGEDPESRIRALMAEREKAYLACGTAVYTDGRTLQQLAEAVERIYRREAGR
jgi:shikimate kinase